MAQIEQHIATNNDVTPRMAAPHRADIAAAMFLQNSKNVCFRMGSEDGLGLPMKIAAEIVYGVRHAVYFTPLNGSLRTASHAICWSNLFNASACSVFLSADGMGNPTGLF